MKIQKRVALLENKDLSTMTDEELTLELHYLFFHVAITKRIDDCKHIMELVHNELVSRGYDIKYDDYRDSDGDRITEVICKKVEEIEWY